MQKFIENTILVIAIIVLSTFMITSIEKADTYTGEYKEKTNAEIWEQQARIERLKEGRN